MPKGDGLTFKYGDYEFDPRPLFTVNKEILRTQSNMGLATKYNLTLNGTILPTGISLDNTVGGVNTVLSGTHDLRTAFNRDFKLLYIQCGTEIDAIISGYPRVLSIDVNHASDNYIRRADYSIGLELASLTGIRSEPVGVDCDGSTIQDLSESGLISVSDDFSIEFVDERAGGRLTKTFGDVEEIPSVLSISRSLSAQGDPLIPCTPEHARGFYDEAPYGAIPASYKEPWERARDYVTANLGLNASMTGLHNLMCVSGLKIANNYRNISVNKTDGSVSATETFIAFSGQHAAIEDFEITVDRGGDSPLTSVSVNGTVQGYNTVDYNQCFGVEQNPQAASTTKFDNANTAWLSISGSLYSRANSAVAGLPPHTMPVYTHVVNINPRPLSESIGYNPIAGSITYSHSYDDRPPNVVPEALVETINYTFTEPNDIFASLAILGRGAGPLIQDINTKGPTTRDISINAVFAATGFVFSGIMVADTPYTKYDIFLEAFENDLNEGNDKSYVNSHTRTWDPKAGSLSINKSWTVAKCP